MSEKYQQVKSLYLMRSPHRPTLCDHLIGAVSGGWAAGALRIGSSAPHSGSPACRSASFIFSMYSGEKQYMR